MEKCIGFKDNHIKSFSLFCDFSENFSLLYVESSCWMVPLKLYQVILQ
jgi:hypothetical protein